MRILALFLFFVMYGCNVSFAQSYVETQSASAVNFLKNPGFENGLGASTGWTTVATECSLGTTAFSGQRNIQCTGVTSAKTLFEQTVSFNNHIPYIDQMWFAAGYIAASVNNNVQICGLLNGVEQDCQFVKSGEVSLNAEGYKRYIATIRLGALTSSFTAGIRVKTVGTTSTAIRADNMWLGPDLVKVVGLYSPETQFSASVDSSGAVFGENIDFINGNCTVSDTSLYTCNFITGFNQNNSPNCIANLSTDVSSASQGADVVNTSINQFQVRTLAGGSKSARAWKVMCQRQGADYNNATQTKAEIVGLVPDETVFSAEINGVNNPSPIISQTPGFLNGPCTRTATGTFTCVFTPNLFSTKPTCVPGSTVPQAFILFTSKDQVEIRTTNSSGTTENGIFTFSCQRQGADYTAARNRFTNISMGNRRTVAATVNSTGVVSKDYDQDLSGNCSTAIGTGIKSCPLKAGTFSAIPNCNCTASGQPSSDNSTISCRFVEVESNSTTLVFATGSDSARLNTAFNFTCYGPK